MLGNPYSPSLFFSVGTRHQAQSNASQTGILLLLTVIPGVVAFVAALVMRAYPLDDAALAGMQDTLAQRRAQEA